MGEPRRSRVESSQKRVRVMFGGEIVADTIRPLLVWEKPYYPTYYFPANDVRRDLLVAAGVSERSPSRGDAERFSVRVADRTAEAAVGYRETSPIDELADTYTFDWPAMDQWFEEDEEVFVHARDPYKRIDALRSSRHVRVTLDGVELADSTRPVILFETGLPSRYYLPKADVRMDLLTPTNSETECPYKGTARYWSVVLGDQVYPDLAWGYDTPLPESAPIAGLISFYNEKVEIVVDGVLQAQPHTVFS
jgi:uncharacterized protein (DUF427 family)